MASKGCVKPANSGRQKGVTNKTTSDIKEAYKLLIENNLDNLTSWLEKVAEKDPAKAISLLSELSEYVLPKLARQDNRSTVDVSVSNFKISDIIDFTQPEI
jgi:hypothetical protein